MSDAAGKSAVRFEAHREWLQFEEALSQGKPVKATLTGQAIMLVFLALGAKALISKEEGC